MFCRAKDACEARTRFVINTVTDGLDDLGDELADPPLPSLGALYEKLSLIEDWCNSQRRRVMGELMAGRQVVGRKGTYKLVEGQQGDRMWANPASVEFILKTVAGDAAYTKKLIGPAGVEKLTKGKTAKVSKAMWAEINKHITRAPASQPRVVLSSDPAPAVGSALDGFEDSSTTAESGFN